MKVFRRHRKLIAERHGRRSDRWRQLRADLGDEHARALSLCLAVAAPRHRLAEAPLSNPRPRGAG